MSAAATAAGGGGFAATAAAAVPPAAKAQRRGSAKGSHSRSYPRGVGLDFRKLAGLTLLDYIDHHGKMVVVMCMCAGDKYLLYVLIVSQLSSLMFKITMICLFHTSTGVPVRPEAPPSELAVAVARHFEAMEVNEEECIGGFLDRLDAGPGPTEYSRKTAYFDGRVPPIQVRKRQRSKMAARPGEQVAAKVTRTDENGSWILASVQRFYPDTETYDVQDEDDTSKLIRLPWNHVMRLSMQGAEGVFTKGKDCMAIFPETTSFYRAKVSKSPVWRMERGGAPVVKEIICKFEDDDDATGRTPHRRVPARYVIPIPADYFYDEVEDVDLALSGGGSAGSK